MKKTKEIFLNSPALQNIDERSDERPDD